MKIFKRPDGSVSNYPDNIEDAKKLKYSYYLPYNDNRPCEHKSVIYTKSGYCRQCQLMKQDIVFRKAFRPDEVVKYVDCMAVYNTISGGLICYPNEWEEELNGLAELLRSGEYRLGGDTCKSYGHVRLVNNSTSCYLCDLEKENRHNSARIEARKRGETWYTPDIPCNECGTLSPRRTQDNVCSHCSGVTPSNRSQANPARIEARKRGDTWYTPDEPCNVCSNLSPRRTQDNICSHCSGVTPSNRSQANPARIEARKRGETWYTPDTPCDVCGTLSPRRTQDNVCSHCSGVKPGGNVNTARAEARHRGDTWYTPDEPCNECGTSSLRRTQDNVCSHCSGITPHGSLSNRKKAQRAGFKFYISEKPCARCGAVGLKRVVNGRCEACNSDNQDAELATSLMMSNTYVSASEGYMVFWDGSGWQLNVDNYTNKSDD